jgi:hypothetical protein
MSTFEGSTPRQGAPIPKLGLGRLAHWRVTATTRHVATAALWGAVLLTSVLETPAQAQRAEVADSPASKGQGPTPAQREKARDLMLEGRVRRDAHNVRGALESFRQAHWIMGVPTTGLELAATQAELRMLVEARRTLSEVLHFPELAGEPDAFKNARAAAERLNAALTDRIPKVRVKCSDSPSASCNVSVDGQAPVTVAQDRYLEVNPGYHELVVSANGRRATAQIDATEKGSKDIVLPSLFAKGAPPPPVPTAPAQSAPTGIVPTLSMVALVIGGAGLAVGAVTGLMARSTARDLENKCPGNTCSTQESGTLDHAYNLATVSTIGFVAGGVLAAGGMVGLLVGSPRPEAPPGAVAIRPWVGWNSVGTRVDF